MEKESIVKAIAAVELAPEIVENELASQTYLKLPLSRVATLGVGLEPVTAALQQVINHSQAVSGYYKVTLPAGTHLAQFTNSPDFLGTVLSNGSNTIAGQAHLTPILCNPTMLFMAAALASVDQKLDTIQETQQEMLDIIIQKEKSQLKGNLDFLTDVFYNYKFNWNDEKYKSANHGQVLAVRRESGQKIDFCREQITKKLGKRSLLHSDQDVRKLREKIESDLEDYRLALYLYGFGYFLEILLQENFTSDYLVGIASKLDGMALQYRDLYSVVYTRLEEMSRSSLQTRVVSGLAAASKTAGGALAKVPVLSKSPVDEALIAAGDKMDSHEAEKARSVLMQLADHQSGCVSPFIEHIQTIDRLYNQPMTMIFDQDTLYLGNA